MAALTAAAVPTPPVGELVGHTRRHVEWHGMERALSQTERTLERLANEKAWKQRERRAVSGTLYAATKPRRVNKPALKLPEDKRPGVDVGISSSATSAATFKEKKASREEQRKKMLAELSIHDGVVVTSETEQALLKRLCSPLKSSREERVEQVFAWEPAKDCRATASRPWPIWQKGEERPGGRLLFHSRGKKIASAPASTAAEHGFGEPAPAPAATVPAAPQPPAGPPKRKGTPSDRRWHDFGTPTRALERRTDQNGPATERAKQLRQEPQQRAGFHKGAWYGQPTPVWGGARQATEPDTNRVHGQFVLHKEHGSGAMPVGPGRVVRGRVPVVAVDPQQYSAMKAYIRSLSTEE